eukprot:5075989-Prorocentrum_lima.AAC.1
MFGGLDIKRFIVPDGFMNLTCVNTKTMRKRAPEVCVKREFRSVTVEEQHPGHVCRGNKGGARLWTQPAVLPWS